MIVVLVGYMASGKSSVGRLLANKLGYDFMDLDDFIESSEGKTITEIFESKGEIYFRKKESESLDKVLQDSNRLVLSLGGGTPCYGNNMERLKTHKNAISVYLKTSIPVILHRVANEKAKRPLIAHLKTEEALTEFVGKHLFERSQFYNQADHIVVTDNNEINHIVEQIILKLY